MPSSNFHSRVRRMHSGRQTENSPSNDELLHFKGSEPAKSVITNSLDHKASRGKKTGIGRDETQAKRRLMLDDTQVVPQPTQRQHKFTTDGNVREPEAGGVSRKATWSEPSAEEASVPVDRKYMVGNAIVTWASGRKVMPKSFSHQCTEAVVAHVGHTPRAGGSPSPPASKQQPQTFGDFSPRVFSSDGVRSSWSPREPCPQHMDKASFHQNMEASVAAHLRDHRNSDVVRQALQPTAVAMGAPRPRPHTAGVSAAPAAGAPVVIETQCADTQVHSYGKLSSMPSSMTKDTAYMHSGLQVVKFGTRMPGLYSPNSPRISASQAVC